MVATLTCEVDIQGIWRLSDWIELPKRMVNDQLDIQPTFEIKDCNLGLNFITGYNYLWYGAPLVMGPITGKSN